MAKIESFRAELSVLHKKPETGRPGLPRRRSIRANPSTTTCVLGSLTIQMVCQLLTTSDADNHLGAKKAQLLHSLVSRHFPDGYLTASF